MTKHNIDGTPAESNPIPDADLKAAVDWALARGASELAVKRAIRAHVPKPGKLHDCPQERRAALLHDLGKLGCPADAIPILRKLSEIACGHDGQFIMIGMAEDQPLVMEFVPNDGEPAQVEFALCAAATKIAALDGYSAHIAPALFRTDLAEGSRGKEADVLGVLAIVSDFDKEHDPATRHDRLPLAPYCEVETSPGNFQCWAFFDKPYAAADVKPVSTALVRALGVDTTQSCDHIYRLPGFMNHPTRKKIASGKRAPGAVMARLHMGADAIDELYEPVSLADLRSAITAKFPDAFTVQERVTAEAAAFDWDTAATPNRKVLTEQEIWERLNDPKFHHDRSAGLASFYMVARMRGHTPEETVAMVAAHMDTAVGNKAGAQADPDQWLHDDVQRWWQKQPPMPTIEDSFTKLEDGAAPKADHKSNLITLPRQLWLPPMGKEELRKIVLPDYSRGRAENTTRNATICIEALGVKCSYDIFHGRKYVSGTPFGSSISPVNDLVAQLIRRVCMEVWPVEFNQNKMYDALTQACLVNQFNPVVDYLASLQWDGTARLETWLIDLFGVADTPYARAVSKIILIAAVRRARYPGTKFDQCVVLEGPEGKNKSTVIRRMAEAAGPGNFADESILTLDQKQQMELLKGIWIYEIADLTGLRKAEIEKVKAFMSKQEDRARAAYDRETSDQKRQCIFFATTNDDTYLQSRTGNRRWWPLKTTQEADLEKLAGMVDQLWAEAAHEEVHGASIVLPPALWPFAAQEQEGRLIADPWEDILAHAKGEKYPLAGYDMHEERIHSTDLLSRYLRLDPAQQNSSNGRRVKQIMTRLGWEHKSSLRIGGRACGGYVRTVQGPMPEPEPADKALPDDPGF